MSIVQERSIRQRTKTHLAERDAEVLKVEHELVRLAVHFREQLAERLEYSLDRLVVQYVLARLAEDHRRVFLRPIGRTTRIFVLAAETAFFFDRARLTRDAQLSEEAVGRPAAG